MKTNKRGGIAFSAAIGISIGVGSTAIRAFQDNLGTPLGFVAGVTLTAVVAYVTALTIQYFMNRSSNSAE